MSLIDLVARTANREELVELLRGTEEQRQRLAAKNQTMRDALEKARPHIDPNLGWADEIERAIDDALANPQAEPARSNNDERNT